MALELTRFTPPLEAQFRATRRAAIADVNRTTYWLVAGLVMVFSAWDWFVDPAGWRTAFAIRLAGALVILACGYAQRASAGARWATAIAYVRFNASVLAVSGALTVVANGWVVGLAGLVAVILSGPYIALDRRNLLALNAGALVAIGLVLAFAGLDRFTIVNASIFVALAVAVSSLLGRVFEVSNRRAFALEQELTREARTDALTGQYNRRAMEEIGTAAVAHARLERSPLAVVIADVDHFKQVNDAHGHAAGDRAIRAVAERLRAAMREGDALGRWGGEEFLAILPGATPAQAEAVAERMRLAVASQPIEGDAPIHATISLGVAVLAPDDASPEPWARLLRDADTAMYGAKAAGRNRTIVAQPAPRATTAS
jgi:diguanylate cyclase (GGDEF)-like protein